MKDDFIYSKVISNPCNTINIMIIYSFVIVVIIFYSNIIIIITTNKSKQLSPYQ